MRDAMVHGRDGREGGGECSLFAPPASRGVTRARSGAPCHQLGSRSCVPDIPLAHWISRSWNPFRSQGEGRGLRGLRTVRRCASRASCPLEACASRISEDVSGGSVSCIWHLLLYQVRALALLFSLKLRGCRSLSRSLGLESRRIYGAGCIVVQVNGFVP